MRRRLQFKAVALCLSMSPIMAQLACPFIRSECSVDEDCTSGTCSGFRCVATTSECTDGQCDMMVGDTPDDCEPNCLDKCSNGMCDAGETPTTCPDDCHCGNGECEIDMGESAVLCKADCYCGDGLCEPNLESNVSCVEDCPRCGDGICHPSEPVNGCPADCTAICNNGICEPQFFENKLNCPEDCIEDLVGTDSQVDDDLDDRLRPACLTAKWPKTVVQYRLPEITNSKTHAIIERLYEEAADQWNGAGISIELQRVEEEDGEEFDITVHVCDSTNPTDVCDLLRQGDVWFAGRANAPSDGLGVRQIVFLPAALETDESQNVLRTIIIHEFGHNLGLCHSAIRGSIMHSNIVNDVLADGLIRTLQADDLLRIRTLYFDSESGVSPEPPTFPFPDPSMLTKCHSLVAPASELDEDGDNLTTSFEQTITNTDPKVCDTDHDELPDGFEVRFGLNPRSIDSDADGSSDFDEVLAGTPARAHTICLPITDDLGTDRDLYLTAPYFDAAGFIDGILVRIENVDTLSEAENVRVFRAPDGPCTVRMNRNLRNELGIGQVHVQVPLAFCVAAEVSYALDFDGGSFSTPVVEGGPPPEILAQDGRNFLHFEWAMTSTNDDAFIVFEIESTPVGLCNRVIIELEVDVQQSLRVELKTPDAEILDSSPITLIAGQPERIDIRPTSSYTLGQIAIVIELDGSVSNPSMGILDIDRILVGSESSPLCSADPVTAVVWTDASSDTIHRTYLGHSSPREVVDDESNLICSPQGIVIDTKNNKMYWADSCSDYDKDGGSGEILRAELDGSDVNVILDDLRSPKHLALDVEAGILYWYNASERAIQRAPIVGFPLRTIVKGTTCVEGLALDNKIDEIYWSDSCDRTIRRAPQDSIELPVAQAEKLFPSLSSSPNGVAIDTHRGLLYWTVPNDGLIQMFVLSDRYPVPVFVDENGPTNGPIEAVSKAGRVVAIAVDEATGALYWTDTINNRVMIFDIKTKVVEELSRGVGYSLGIAVGVVELESCAE